MSNYTRLNPDYIVEAKSSNSTTFAANGITTVSISAAKTGYTPIGIVGWYVSAGSPSLVTANLRISSGNVSATVQNRSDSAITSTFNAYVLYKKS